MIGIIILISLLICALCLLIALLYIRQTEIEVKDKSVDLESVLPIQTITENAVINGNGDITVGYRLLLPGSVHLVGKRGAIHPRAVGGSFEDASGRHGHPSAEFLLYGAIPSCRILFQCPDSGEQPSFQRQGDTEQLHQPVCDVHERQPKR